MSSQQTQDGQCKYIFWGNYRAEIVRIPLDGVSSGATLVAAPGSGFKILFLAAVIRGDATGTMYLSSSGGTKLTGNLQISIGNANLFPVSYGWGLCGDNEGLVLTLGTATAATGVLVYAIVKSAEV